MQGPFHYRQGQGVDARGPAIAVVETTSVARGLVVADAMVKRAPVTLVLARPVSSGKHVILVSGEVADVEEALGAALAAAGATLIDKLILPYAAEPLLAALGQKAPAPAAGEALGIFETFSIAAAVTAADAACKAAAVALCELRLGDGLGGKAYFVLGGAQADVEAALAAAERVTPTGLMLARELIARPHDDLLPHLR